MTFPFNIYGGAFLAAFLVSLLTFPLWRRWCLWAGHIDDPGHRKIHSSPTPLAGGLTVMTGFFIPLVAGAVAVLFWRATGPDLAARELLGYGLSRRAWQIVAILTGAFGMVLLGWLDDRLELKPLPKFSGQTACALLVAISGIRITLFIHSEFINYLVTVLWILTLTNAFNFLDNMNGLCSGLGIISSWCCAWAAALHGQYLVAMLAFLICGALAGFFPFNFPKARAFLGDAGSHLVGFLVAVLAVLPNFYSRENPKPLAVLSPLLIAAVPIYDLVSVIIIRARAGQPIYQGDNNHISHRLVRRGYTRTHAVLLLLLVNGIASGAALLFLVR
jgi:UDP-GlcNAc:undecaprenyl-phosphate/decaprenyl-phosphate GlcNAc-1-phosphate transferase